MSGGYTPVFRSIFTGTLFGKYPDLPLWLVLLAMADKNGIVDAHPSYISAACGIDQGDVEECIGRFCQPDPASRTPDDDGRRLVALEGRGFGWRIVNHGKYRERARKQAWDAERTESGRDAERKREQRAAQNGSVPTRPDASRRSPLSDADADTDPKKNHPSGDRARKRAAPPRKRCPEDFQVPDPERAKIRSECPDVDLLTEERKFRDHEFARGRSDWLATWRNWMREAQTRSTKVNGHHSRPTRYDELRARSKAKAELPREPSALTQMLIEAKL